MIIIANPLLFLRKETPDEITAQALLLHCVTKILKEYHGTLGDDKNGNPKPFIPHTYDRKIKKKQYTISELIDVALLDYCKTSKAKQYQKKLVKIKISNHKECIRWPAKMQTMLMLFLNIKSKEAIEDAYVHHAIVELLKTKLSLKGCLVFLLKYNRLSENKTTTYFAKAVIKSLKANQKKAFMSAVKQGGLSSKDIQKIDEDLQPAFAIKGEVTFENCPQYFTIEAPHLKLDLPIPDIVDKVVFGKDRPVIKSGKNKGKKPAYYAMWEDPTSGEVKHAYIVGVRENNDAHKWVVIRAFIKARPKIKKRIKEGLKDSNVIIKRKSLMVALVEQGSFRIGNMESEKDGVRGLGTLLVKHITISGDSVSFDYTAKKQKSDTMKIKVTKQALAIFKACVKGKGPEEFVFTNEKGERITEGVINTFLTDYIGAPEGVTIHKFRHVNATIKTRAVLKNPPFTKDTTLKEKQAWYKEQLEKVRAYMRHDSIKTTLDAYIDPDIIVAFEKKYGLSPVLIAKAKNKEATKKATDRIEVNNKKIEVLLQKIKDKPGTKKSNTTKIKALKVANTKSRVKLKKLKDERRSLA